MQENNGAAIVYEAFISYRHKELDTAVAKAIHRQLETYRIPAYIKKRTGKSKIGKVFRDQDELPLLADLGEGIHMALDASKWLIVICSPDLPLSKWCMAEIDYFIGLGKRDRILTVLVSGEPEESFPPQLRFVRDEAGEVSEREPLAADVRAESASKAVARVKKEKLRILAPMLGVGFDDLRRRQRERFLRLVLACGLSAALFFAAFGGFALYQSATIARQNAELTEQKSKIYANFSQEQLDSGNRAGASILALEALPGDIDAIPREAKNALYDAAYRSYGDLQPVVQVPGDEDVVLAPDGKTFVAAAADCSRVYDAETFRLIYEHPGATTTIMAFESGDTVGAQVKRAVYDKTGETVFLPGGEPVFVNVRTGEVVKEGYFTDADELADFGLSRYECVNQYDSGRYIVDLGSGETLFSAPTKHSTSKNLFSPNGKYYIVATYTGLDVYDMEQRALVNKLPCDGIFVRQGYTFFSPDSRFLVLTREYFEKTLVAGSEQSQRVYSIQVLEIPSCRVAYESVLQTELPNYYHGDDSDMPALLFSPDSSKLLLPVEQNKFGLLDLASGEMLFTQFETPRFASFSPSGRQILTINQNRNTMKLLDSRTGEAVARFYDFEASFIRGFILPDENSVLMTGSGLCGIYELDKETDTEDIGLYFSDESGRYIQPGIEGKNAAVADGNGGASPIELEDSAGYTKEGLFAAAGGVVVGLDSAGVDSVLSSWDAATGKRIVEEFAVPEGCWISTQHLPPPFSLSPDGSRVTATYQKVGITVGGFRTFDTKTGEVLAENTLVLGDAEILLDRDVTKVLYVYNNEVSVFDALTGEKLFALDDYPKGRLALGIWSGHKAAISGDGSLIAVSHSKKSTLEIIDAATGTRLHEIPLGASATTAPCFANDGSRVTIGAGKYLISVDSATGNILFSFYEEAGFSADYRYSQDDRYLLGPDIRDAKTGEAACSVSLPIRPEREISGTAGVKIPMGKAHAVYLPSVDEAIEDLRGHIREYEFTKPDRLKFSLD